jgi:predicted acyltransferase
VLSYGGKRHDLEKGLLYRKIVWRALKIYALGIFLNLLPWFDFYDLRYTGTLPRIALVFLPCAILFLTTSFRQQLWTGISILIAYWLAMTLIPTPGVGKVVLEPGVNLAAWVDSKFLPGKMWQGTWDPEGILSTFPSIVSGICGLLAGHLLVSKRTPTDKVIYLMVFGLISAVAGYVWSLAFPLNENLWTSSFVLLTSGFAALILGATYYVVDIRGYQGWTFPGIVFGANAITVYVLADILALAFYVLPWGGETLNIRVTSALTTFGLAPKLSSCVYALLFVGINFIPAFILYRKKIFIKV